MYPLSRVRDVRELDLFIFGGVPEIPEPNYERDIHAYSEMRTSRLNVNIPSANFTEQAKPIEIGHLILDVEKGVFTFCDSKHHGSNDK